MNMSFEIGRNPGPSCHAVLTTTPDFQSWEAVPQFCIVHGILIDCLRVWSVDVFTRSYRSYFQYIIALPVI